MLKKLILTLLLTLPALASAVDLGVVATTDNLRFRVHALDSTGLPAAPDSGHVLVWFEGEATADAASYSAAWTGAASGTALLDTVRFNGHTYYYFIDAVADIDNGEGQGVYTGDIVLFCDGGLPTSNPFTFTIGEDELADLWANVLKIVDLDSLAVIVRDTIMKTDTSTLTSAGSFGEVNSGRGWFNSTTDLVIIGDSTGSGRTVADQATSDSSLVVLLKHLRLAGFMPGTSFSYTLSANADTLTIKDNVGTDTLLYLYRNHSGGSPGDVPTTGSAAAGPDF